MVVMIWGMTTPLEIKMFNRYYQDLIGGDTSSTTVRAVKDLVFDCATHEQGELIAETLLDLGASNRNWVRSNFTRFEELGGGDADVVSIEGGVAV